MFSRSALSPYRRSVVLIAGLIVAGVVQIGGLAPPIDRLLDPLRAVASGRPPSGRVVVVEMDAASVARIQRWPWPRDQYAAIIDRLRRAGAASITFDVDLSSRSTADGDRAMAAALARADGLVALPTFGQQERSGDTRTIDTLPLPMFRSHAALVSVNMLPDSDGVVRRAPFGTITGGTPRPSLSSYMAHRSGTADDSFPIDFGVDPTQLPRLSFVTVRDGRFDPARVRGRDVLIGATAVEMGDRYATPHWGVVPGVIVQALAAETLLHGAPEDGSAATSLLLAGLLAALILAPRSARLATGAALGAPILLFALAVWAQLQLRIVYPLAPGLALLAVAALGRGALHLTGRFESQRRTDEGTGLPNRRAMTHDLAPSPATPVAVALVGNFDTLVTLLGERAGHDLILRLAERLRAGGGGTVYRLADRLLAIELAEPVAELPGRLAALQALLTQPVEILGRQTDAAVHLGIADGPEAMPDRLVNATRAAEEAAASGIFWRHSEVDVEELERRLVLMGELDQALGNGQIEVHYQPKLLLATNEITSVEALVRWRHPVRGMLRPDLFIPLAEQSDRIGPLTLFVLDRVTRDLAHWRQAGIDLTAAVNLSATLIAVPAFGAAVDAILGAGRVPPDRLIFEITESATLADPDRATEALRAFGGRGVAISMDDYGTGHSTLSYLRQLPLSELKIDRTFVQHVHLRREDEVMVRSTIDLAHDLGLKVVAEGVEDADCLELLRAARCDMVQGYLISRPVAASELLALLTRQRAA